MISFDSVGYGMGRESIKRILDSATLIFCLITYEGSETRFIVFVSPMALAINSGGCSSSILFHYIFSGSRIASGLIIVSSVSIKNHHMY